MTDTPRLTLNRTFQAPLEEVWALWTTKAGIESWWGPEGFAVSVQSIDLRPGGELRYVMTATGEGQIQFMKNAGMPLSTPAKLTFTEVSPMQRLGYATLADFVPGVAPYEVHTLVEFQTGANGVAMTLTFDAMHDDVWTQRALMGHGSELRKLEAEIARRRLSAPS